jgi:hypothetical protein
LLLENHLLLNISRLNALLSTHLLVPVKLSGSVQPHGFSASTGEAPNLLLLLMLLPGQGTLLSACATGNLLIN